MNTLNSSAVSDDSLTLARDHYENFPVASVLLPMRLRRPIGMIYAFARRADDFADEDELDAKERLTLLDGFRQELNRMRDQTAPETDFFIALQATINKHQLPLQPFYDLLDAFSQDVVKTRYADFGEVIHYCRRSANPIGRLLLHLYGHATPRNIGLADAICSALQIINFLQDIAIDYKKGRIYLPQDEMRKYNITESQIASGNTAGTWAMFMEFEINRARRLLQSGAPLGLVLPGRMGLEMRTIIAGGERILRKLHSTRGDIFNQRPTLNYWDWTCMLYRAVSKR